MSSRRPLRRQDDYAFGEGGAGIGSFLMIVAGGLLFLALATYTPDDLGSWTGISTKEPPNDPAMNSFGPAGATVAGYAMFLLGGGAYLLPFGLLWLGLARINMGLNLMPRPLPGFALFVLSGSVFLGSQTWWLQDWWREYNILGAGGGIGWLGKLCAQKTVNTGGVLILSMAGYALGLILMTGIRPQVVIGSLQRVMMTGWRQIMFRLSGERRMLVEASEEKEAAQLAAEQRKTERERRRLEKELRKQPAGEEGTGLHVPLDPSGALDLDALDAEVITSSQMAASEKGGKKQKAAAVPAAARNNSDDDRDEDDLEEGDAAAAEEREEGVVAAEAEPPIINGSRRNQPTGEAKLSLAEWRKQQQKPREGAATGAAGGAGGGKTIDFSNYQLPPLAILHWDENAGDLKIDERALRETQRTIINTLSTFGIQVTPGPITRGPTISRYEIYPSEGLRVGRITALEADLARATRAERINILAPIPGKDTVGIEIANSDKVAVPLRELLEDDTFARTKAKLPLALGKDVYGNTIIADLAAMPHLLVAGATGSGKSVCINSIIGSLLFQFTPEELRFIMIDPKVVEMQTYNDLPHLVVPVVTDPKKVIMALRWVVNEMEHRYRLFANEGVRNFESFNNRKAKKAAAGVPADLEKAVKARSSAKAVKQEKAGATPMLPLFDETSASAADDPVDAAGVALPGDTARADRDDEAKDDGEYVFLDQQADEPEEVLTMHQVSLEPSGRPEGANVWDDSALIAEEEAEEEEESSVPDTIPYIVVIIDELADLMQTAPADMEQLIQRIAQKARAAGIHMILATQTPRAEVITGNIKANIPCRIAFQVSSALDSRVIMDTKGAEKLVGKGDMLYLPPGTSKLCRAQGAFVTDDEIAALVAHCNTQAAPTFDKSVQASLGDGPKEVEEISDEDEETLERCIEVIMVERKASTSLLQRRLRLGYGRAARMMDLLEQRGFIGPGDGAKPREVLIAPDDDEEM